MSVKKEASGRRSIQVEVEVPGTLEEVWQAIATGPGVSCWFVPTEIEERVGGAVVSRFGPGMEGKAPITEWEPPHRFAAESDMGGRVPKMATEWIVEPRAGGMCVVRVVHSLFASTDDWDNQLTGVESGWPAFFRVLRIYLTFFRGLGGRVIQLLALTDKPSAKAWAELTESLGLAGLKAGDKWTAPSGTPAIAGTIEAVHERDNHYQALVLLEQAAGVASLIVTSMGPKSAVQISLFYYGEFAGDVVEKEEPRWAEWMTRQFPTAAA